jgi:tetratricopeptide (TPR) repeat protein
MIISAARLLVLVLALMASCGTTASGEGDERQEWSRRIEELQKAGRQVDAIALAEEYREKMGERYGNEHPHYAIALKVLANLLQDADRVQEAELLLRRALDIDEKSLGPEHPDVAADLNELGVLLQDSKRFEEAEPLLRRALVIDEMNLGPDHKNVAVDLFNLGIVLRNANRTVEAERLLRRSLAIEEKNFGPEHPRLVSALTELALLLSINGQIAESRQLFYRMLTIKRSSEAATAAEHLCNTERQQKIDSATKQKVEAHRKLESCRKDYEKTKTIFTLETVEERCRQPKAYADRADRNHRAADTTFCPPAPRQ